MKSFIYLLTLSLFVTACSLSRDNKSVRTSINGIWQLSKISYEGNQGRFESVIFNDVSDACFQGSEWSFRANNSNGSYNITQGDCNPGQRFFIWSVVAGNNVGSYALQIKPSDIKRNSTLNNAGYRLEITQLNGGSMTLKSRLQVDGEPITLVYEFQKLSS